MNWLFHLVAVMAGQQGQKIVPSEPNQTNKKENKQNPRCLNKYQKKKKSLQNKVASYHW